MEIYQLLSSNGIKQLQLYYWPVNEPKAMVQILHGASEHIGRYETLAKALNEAGFAVIGHDYLGHGETAENQTDLGFIDLDDPFGTLIEDALKVGNHIHSYFATCPIFLLGFSMGASIAKMAVAKQPHLYTGLMLAGTSGPRPEIALIRPYLAYLNKAQPFSRNYQFQQLIFGAGGNQNKALTNNAIKAHWLPPQPGQAAVAQPKIGFVYTNNGFKALTDAFYKAGFSKWLRHLPKDFPIVIAYGGNDPTSFSGKTINILAHQLASKGFKHVRLLNYPQKFHEILTDKGYEVVHNDLIAWLKQQTK